MTGTALTESEEFLEIYGLSVIEIPTHKPMVRIDQNDQIYKTPDEKYKAVLDLVKEKYEKGQPILVGTTSIEKSNFISDSKLSDELVNGDISVELTSISFTFTN